MLLNQNLNSYQWEVRHLFDCMMNYFSLGSYFSLLTWISKNLDN